MPFSNVLLQLECSHSQQNNMTGNSIRYYMMLWTGQCSRGGRSTPTLNLKYCYFKIKHFHHKLYCCYTAVTSNTFVTEIKMVLDMWILSEIIQNLQTKWLFYYFLYKISWVFSFFHRYITNKSAYNLTTKWCLKAAVLILFVKVVIIKSCLYCGFH